MDGARLAHQATAAQEPTAQRAAKSYYPRLGDIVDVDEIRRRSRLLEGPGADESHGLHFILVVPLVLVVLLLRR